MAICLSCGKQTIMRSWSRHQKGSSGHGGAWNLRAQISKKPQHPNLHSFKGEKYCTKCLRIAKTNFANKKSFTKVAETPTTQPV